MVLGNISAMRTQQIGPHENMKDALYTIILSMVTRLRLSLPNVTATPNAPIAIPMEPTISKGFLPSFSTVNTATRVNNMFTTPITTVFTIGSVIPISPKMRGA